MSRPLHISSSGVHTFTPKLLETILKDDEQVPRDPLPVFSILIPTFAQRDNLSSLLFSQGCMPITREHGRAVLISELYNSYRIPTEQVGVEAIGAAGQAVGDPDEIATFLEGYWQQSEVYEEVISMWALQERERILDELAGAEPIPAKEMPAAPYSARDTARAKMVSMDMLELSQNYRNCQAKFADYDAREDLTLFRLFVTGWTGLTSAAEKDATGKLSETCVEALRTELSNEGIHDAYLEVVTEVRGLMTIDRETEKNSDSPRGQSSSPSGLSAESDGSANGGGEWTGSNTEPTPDSESAQTSSTSPSSRSAPAKAKAKTAGQTAGP